MKEEEYMRVGTTLYKVVNQPCANGGYEKKRVVWNNSTLRQDYGKNYLATVPKYDGFCTVPNHLNYQKEIEGFLNLYVNPEKPDVPLNKNDAFQKVQKRRVQEKR